jgi:hypothetical protein
MTQDEMSSKNAIIEMANKAYAIDDGKPLHPSALFHLEIFAKLVRNDYSNKHAELWLKRIDDAVKAEREACAKVCEAQEDKGGEWDVQQQCANAVRARGEQQ